MSCLRLTLDPCREVGCFIDALHPTKEAPVIVLHARPDSFTHWIVQLPLKGVCVCGCVEHTPIQKLNLFPGLEVAGA